MHNSRTLLSFIIEVR